MYRDLIDEEIGGYTQRKHQMRLDRLRAIEELGYVIQVRVDRHHYPYCLFKKTANGKLDFIDCYSRCAYAINRAEKEAKNDAE